MFTREYSLQTGFAKGFDMRSILWPGSSVEREESLEPVFVGKCSFQVCSVFILARRGYKVGLVEIGVGARKLKSWAFRASSSSCNTHVFKQKQYKNLYEKYVRKCLFILDKYPISYQVPLADQAHFARISFLPK